MRAAALASVLLLTPLGLATKAYDGPGSWWVQDYLGGVIYVMFWIAAVLAVTCLLEVLQLWQPPLLQQVRGTFAGRALLGTTFVWWDFPHYAAGAAAGGGLGSWLRGRVAAQRPPCAGAPSRRR